MLPKILLLLWTLVILFLSLYPFDLNENSTRFWTHSDKVVHFGMYAVFSFLLSINTKCSFQKNYTLLITLFFSIFYGIVIEVLQHVMNLGRSFDFLDVIANSAGALFGLTGYIILKNRGILSDN